MIMKYDSWNFDPVYGLNDWIEFVQDCTPIFVQDCTPKSWDIQDCTDPFVQKIKYIYVEKR